MIKVIFSYYICINGLAFIMMLLDKWYAVKNKWRIPENVLIGSALLGGGVGLVTAMVVVRHKLSKWKFRFFGPISILLFTILLGYFVFYESQWFML